MKKYFLENQRSYSTSNIRQKFLNFYANNSYKKLLFRDTRTECTVFDPSVADAKWQDPDSTWKLLRMCILNEKIKIPHAHAHFERENNTVRCACALQEKFIFCTGPWPSQILHLCTVLCTEGASDSREVCNTSRHLVLGSSRLRSRLTTTRLWPVLLTSHTRLELPLSYTYYTI